jgi:ribosomal protein L11 methyltransferase
MHINPVKIDICFCCLYNVPYGNRQNMMSYHELSIIVTERYRDTLILKLMNTGCLGVIEEDDSIVAYFPDTTDINEITNELTIQKALLGKSCQTEELAFHHALIPDQDWNEAWKKGFHAIDVGTFFTVLPPWECEHNGRINLIIDPAMAFGTGHHETTRSCLVLMEKYFVISRRGSFLDVGTGTGILAIAAAKLGYRRVVGVDTDILAVNASRMNIDLNHVPGIDIREGSTLNLDETFDFITANIISGVLVVLAPSIAAHLKPGGIAILSGILNGQDEEIAEAMIRTGLKIVERYPDGKWISLAVSG